MSLQAKLDAFKADFEAGKPPYNVPASVIETMHRATNELVASGAAAKALRAGDRAPSFVLNDPDGSPSPPPTSSPRDRSLSASIAACGAPTATWSCRPCRARCHPSVS